MKRYILFLGFLAFSISAFSQARPISRNTKDFTDMLREAIGKETGQRSTAIKFLPVSCDDAYYNLDQGKRIKNNVQKSATMKALFDYDPADSSALVVQICAETLVQGLNDIGFTGGGGGGGTDVFATRVEVTGTTTKTIEIFLNNATSFTTTFTDIDTFLSDADIAAMGYIKTEIDGDATNELQDANEINVTGGTYSGQNLEQVVESLKAEIDADNDQDPTNEKDIQLGSGPPTFAPTNPPYSYHDTLSNSFYNFQPGLGWSIVGGSDDDQTAAEVNVTSGELSGLTSEQAFDSLNFVCPDGQYPIWSGGVRICVDTTRVTYDLAKQNGGKYTFLNEDNVPLTDTITEYLAGQIELASETVENGIITMPSGMTWNGSSTLPIEVYATDKGATTNVSDTKAFRDTFKLDFSTPVIRYVDFSAPNGGDGLTVSTAYNDIVDAISDGANSIFIYCEEGQTCIGTRLSGYSLGGRDLNIPANVIGIGGGDVIMGTIEEARVFTQNATFPNVYEMTKTATGDSWYIDLDLPKISKGLYPHMREVASLAECAANPSSFFDDGTTIYLHLSSGELPVIGTTDGPDVNMIIVANNGQNTISVTESYFENVTLYNKINVTNTNADAILYGNNFNVFYSRGTDDFSQNSLVDINGTNAIFYRCHFAFARMDGADYHLQGSNISHAIEIDCTMHDCGYDVRDTQSHQNSTMHDGGTIVRIGDGIERNGIGDYFRSQHQNIFDINLNTFSWNVGISAYDTFNKTTSTTFNANAIAGVDAKAYYQKCTFGGNAEYSLSTIVNGIIYLREVENLTNKEINAALGSIKLY